MVVGVGSSSSSNGNISSNMNSLELAWQSRCNSRVKCQSQRSKPAEWNSSSPAGVTWPPCLNVQEPEHKQAQGVAEKKGNGNLGFRQKEGEADRPNQGENWETEGGGSPVHFTPGLGTVTVPELVGTILDC